LVAYAATEGQDFGALDLSTGQYTSLSNGPTNLPAGISITGMGFIGGTLYGVDNDLPNANLYSINGKGVTSAPTALSVSAIGGTTFGGAFYGMTQDNPAALFAVDASGTSLPTPPLSPGFNQLADGLVAVGAAGGNLYVSLSNTVTGTDDLYSINLTTGATSFVSSLGQLANTGLISGNTLYTVGPQYDVSGNLLGDFVFTYSLSNVGAGPTSIQAIMGLPSDSDLVFAVAVVPEPSSIAIAGVVLAMAGLVHSRRRYLAA
jgi:hypothetical protein